MSGDNTIVKASEDNSRALAKPPKNAMKMNLSFAGCGFLGIYHVGVAVCFRKYAPHLLLNKISGASAGAIAACSLLCDLPLGDITSDVLRVATEARSRALGPFHPSFNIQAILLDAMEKILPEDAHLRVSGKLHISLTRVYDGKNVIVSEFNSREEVMQALLASAFIPVFSGIMPPKFRGVRYIDGGFSDNLPTIDENTITVSPFCGESDICPRDDSMQLFHVNIANTSIELSQHNVYRIARILFPPKPEVLSNMCKQGFDDALRFLNRNNLINCTRCLSVQSTFAVNDAQEEADCEYDPQCKECKIHRQEALVSNLPDTVLTIFQDAIDSANNGIVNWVFRHRGMKLLSVLSLPYTLPADMVYATFTNVLAGTYETRHVAYQVKGHARLTKYPSCSHLNSTNNNRKRLMARAPMLGKGLMEVSKYFLDQLQMILDKLNAKRRRLNARISYNLSMTQYGDQNGFDIESGFDRSGSPNRMNMNLTVDLDDDADNFRTEFSSTHLMNSPNHQPLQRALSSEEILENIAQVTQHHEPVVAFYYMDEDNKVQVTEIFDVTDSDSPAFQTEHEREANQQLMFDDENWVDDSQYLDEQEDYLSIEDRCISMGALSSYSIESILDRGDNNLFSDPESEWTGSWKVEEPTDGDFSDTRPESERSAGATNASKPRTIPTSNYRIDY